MWRHVKRFEFNCRKPWDFSAVLYRGQYNKWSRRKSLLGWYRITAASSKSNSSVKWHVKSNRTFKLGYHHAYISMHFTTKPHIKLCNSLKSAQIDLRSRMNNAFGRKGFVLNSLHDPLIYAWLSEGRESALISLPLCICSDHALMAPTSRRKSSFHLQRSASRA